MNAWIDVCVCLINLLFFVCYFISLCIHRALHRMAHTTHHRVWVLYQIPAPYFFCWCSVWFVRIIHTITLLRSFVWSLRLAVARSLHRLCMRGWVAFNRNELTYISTYTAPWLCDGKSIWNTAHTHTVHVYISSGCYYYSCRRCRSCRLLLCDVMYTTKRCPYLINNNKKSTRLHVVRMILISNVSV